MELGVDFQKDLPLIACMHTLHYIKKKPCLAILWQLNLLFPQSETAFPIYFEVETLTAIFYTLKGYFIQAFSMQ